MPTDPTLPRTFAPEGYRIAVLTEDGTVLDSFDPAGQNLRNDPEVIHDVADTIARHQREHAGT